MILLQLKPFLIATSLGALIGLMRQWVLKQEGTSAQETAGLRTLLLWSLLGCLSGYLNTVYPFAFIAILVLFVLSVTAYQLASGTPKFGLTTSATGIITFIVGTLCFLNQFQLATTITVGIIILMYTKNTLHTWSSKLSPLDMQLFLQFIAITGVILPLVPNQPMGPFNALNPRSVWLMVVLISGLGFIGYVLSRWLGAKTGIFITSITGGIASSTATTLAFSRQSKEPGANASVLGIGIVIACTIMLVRITVITFFLHKELGLQLASMVPFVAAPALLYGAFYSKLSNNHVSAPILGNPLSLKTAIKFALLYAVVKVTIVALGQQGANSGLYIVSFLSGLSDMDAIALSSTNAVVQSQMTSDLALKLILIGAAGNSVVKGLLVYFIGSKEIGKGAGVVLGITALVCITLAFI